MIATQGYTQQSLQDIISQSGSKRYNKDYQIFKSLSTSINDYKRSPDAADNYLDVVPFHIIFFRLLFLFYIVPAIETFQSIFGSR